jgi:N-6 DNA Methylase
MPTAFAIRAQKFLLGGGYAPTNVIVDYTFACLDANRTLKNAKATVAGFAESPHTMRTACIGAYEIDDANKIPEVLDRARYLTAPIAMVKTPDDVQLFGVRTSVDLEPLETAATDDFEIKFKSRISDFSPSALFQIKLSSRHHDLFDVGLWPWAENITSGTLVKLLEALVVEAIDKLPESYRHRDAAQKAIIKLIFHLFACRVLQDKDLIPATDDPYESLKIAHEKFSDNIDPEVTQSPFTRRTTVIDIAAKLRTRFAFSSLTSEMLGSAYENSLVTPKLRRERGIYYTPRSITSYVLSQLPIESISEEDRYLCDPCCGSGSFLLAGFERLTELLSGEWTASRRHQYLQARLLGFDIDDFAREIATLSLVLADVYNKNGWKIRPCDATNITATDVGRKPHIIITNPPFRHTKQGGHRKEIAADILVNLIELLAENGLMGIILPQSALDSGAAEKARRAMLQKCDLLEIDLMSSGLFFSGAEVAIVLLRKRRKGEPAFTGVTTIREVRPSQISAFKTDRVFTRTYSANPQKWRLNTGQKFVISPLSELWERLKMSCPPLRSCIRLATGLQVNKFDKRSVRESNQGGDKRYVDRLDVLRPFALLPDDESGKYKWINYGDQLRRLADPKIFQSAKVLLNATRNAGSVWRMIAAVAPKDLYFSDYFHAAVPITAETSLEEITAVLNGPIANAWFDAHCRKRKIVLKTLGELPFPLFSAESRKEIVKLVRELGTIVAAKWKKSEYELYDEKLSASDKSIGLVSRIDTIVANEYKLSLDEIWQLGRLVGTDRRPS